MSFITTLLNKLLPFATPGTPLIQDLLHLGVICTILYFAPQIQDHFQHRNQDLEGHPDRIREDAVPVEETRGEAPDPTDRDINIEQPNARIDNDLPTNDDHDDVPGIPFGQQQQQQPHGNAEEAGPLPGPANINNNGPSAARNNNVGTKKAKSLARRDQRRAYNEFMRTQGEAQRARDAEGAAEREAMQAAERARRKAAEEALESKRAKEREKRREKERRKREEETARRERAVSIVRQGLDERRMCNLLDVADHIGGDADEIWVEKILNASGMVGRSRTGLDEEDGLTMVTSTGWVVRVREEDMKMVYRTVLEQRREGEDGEIEYDELGKVLENVLRGNLVNGKIE